MIHLYCGVSESEWNGTPPAPGHLACVSPVKGRSFRTKTETRVRLPPNTQVLQDSGAFQDSIDNRLSFQNALDRQIAHAAKYHYQVDARISYDLLIDESWQDGTRLKRRWSVQDAEHAIGQTIAAARFLSENRHDIPHLVLSLQGVNARQYLDCAERVVGFCDPQRDWIGLGGWCIIGKLPSQMMPVFRDTIIELIPFLAKQQIQRVHILGVLYPQALGELLWLCDQHGMILSTDSAGPQLKPCFGDWGYGDWRDNDYKRALPSVRSLDRIRHLQQTRRWLYGIRATQYYQMPRMIQPKMLSTGQRQLALNLNLRHNALDYKK